MAHKAKSIPAERQFAEEREQLAHLVELLRMSIAALDYEGFESTFRALKNWRRP